MASELPHRGVSLTLQVMALVEETEEGTEQILRGVESLPRSKGTRDRNPELLDSGGPGIHLSFRHVDIARVLGCRIPSP
jgi:hypothetical protein